MTHRFTLPPWRACAVLALAGITFVPSPVASHEPAAGQSDALAVRGIRAEVYDATRHAAYAQLFGRSDWSATARHTVILTNETSQDVHAVVFRWAIDDAAGRVRWHTLQIDSYSRESGAPVVRARSSAAVTPSGIVPLEFIGQRFITSAMVSSALAATLEASRAAPLLDSAILATGEIVGPDGFDIAGYLMSRGLAAEMLLDELDRGNFTLESSRWTLADTDDRRMATLLPVLSMAARRASDPRGALLRQATVPPLYR